MGFIEQEYKVILFIQALIKVLNNEECFFIFKRERKSEKIKPIQFTNKKTLIDLDYDKEDVKKELISLKIEEYIESIEDKNTFFNDESFRVFVKKIKDINVYIKVKIRDIDKKIVVCISFHRAQFDFKFPYN